MALKAVAAMVADGLEWEQLLADFHDGYQLELFVVGAGVTCMRYVYAKM